MRTRATSCGATSGGESGVEGAGVFLPPDVADALAPRELQVGPRDGDLLRDDAGVEEADGPRAVFQRFGVDDGVVGVRDRRGLAPERVLVDGEHLVIAEQADSEVVERVEIAADEQRRGEQAPERDVGVLLLRRQARGMGMTPADVADDEHVGIVPVTGPPVGAQRSW